MIQLPKVHYFLLKNPFYWPWFFHVAVLLLITIPYAVLFSYTFIEKKQAQENKTLFLQRLENRQREILSLKLSGLETYQWQPALQCKTLSSDDNPQKAQNEKCFLTTIAFIKQASAKKYTSPFMFDKQKNKTFTVQEVDPPCLVCHRKEKNVALLFAHQIVPPNMSLPVNRFFYSESFYWFSMSLLLLILLFYLLRLYFFLRGDLRIVALAILNEQMDQKAMLELSKELSLDDFFLYRETGNGYVRAYLSRRKFRLWIKNYFTPNLGKWESKFGLLRAAAFTTRTSSLLRSSSEGIRVAQNIAAKPQENAFLLERELLKGLLLNEAGKQAFWKSQDKKIEFRFLKLK